MTDTCQARFPRIASLGSASTPTPIFLTLLLVLCGTSSACHDGADGIGRGETDPEGALVGRLESFVVDGEDGASTRESYLVLSDPAQTRLRLVFDGLDAPTGSGALRAWGLRQGQTLRVLHFETIADDDAQPADGIARASAALVGSAPKPRTAVFVIVDVGGGTKLTNDGATSTLFTPGKNFADVYNQISYGIIQMSGDVVGPLSYPTTTCDYNGVARTLRPMIQGTYNHYMWYFASNPGCAWSGLGAEGNVTHPQTDSWYNASTGCTVLVQEVGHNMGWMHSSTLRCPGASFADNPLTCTSSEYGNRYTPMGSGCGHFAAYDKWYGGIFSGCNGVKVTASGTFNLLPLESACNGVQGIQIPMLKTTRTADPQQGSPQPLKHYYLEYRGPWGLDTAVKTPQVMVYAGDDVHAASKTSNWTWLLDMAPSSTSTFEGLATGQAFTDPAGGITVTVVSTDTTKAVVQIDVEGGAGAPPTCMDDTTLADSGPVDCQALPGLGGASGSQVGSGGGGPGTGGAPGVQPGSGGRAVVTSTGGTSGGLAGTGGRSVVFGTGGAPGLTGSGGAPAVGASGGSPGSGTEIGSGGQSIATGGTPPGTGPIGPASTGGAGSGIGNGPGSSAPVGVGAAGGVNGGCVCGVAAGDGAAGLPVLLTALGCGLIAARRRPRRPRSPLG
jgi:hypothetical protein